MRKFCFVFVMAFGAMAFAQEFQLGVKGGLNLGKSPLSVQSSSATLNASFGASYYAGVFVETSLPVEKLSVAAELLLVDSKSYYNLGDNQTENISLLDVVVPVLAKYEVAEGLQLNGGVFASYLASAQFSNYDGNDAYNDANKFNAGLLVGAEYQVGKLIDASVKGLFVEARYNFGLLDRSKAEELTVKTQFLQFGVGYRF